MHRRFEKLADWLEGRTGLVSALRNFFFETIPGSSGWPQVFGGVALFLFVIQLVTGILLACNYAPTPGEAYDSVLFIVRKVTAGNMIRGLHHWGASFMIIIVFVHMVQVFIYGAYKKPREATWIAGSMLLLLVLAFGLTGYLLPWDNRAYWGTMVTARIIGSIPFAGGFLTRIIGAEDNIGVLTFSRFYTLHSVVLPAITVLLIALHVYLVRLHGVTPSVREVAPKQTFYPRQMFRDIVAIFCCFGMLFAATAFLEVPLERLADPTDTTYIPRPEWYFLFLFQLLKIFKGSLEPIGTVVLPTLAVVLLFAIPFLDRSRVDRLSRRTAAIAAAALVFCVWLGLTGAAVAGSPHPLAPRRLSPVVIEAAQLSPEQLAGFAYFQAAGCSSCHNLLAGGPKPGPTLASAELHHPKEWLIQHFNSEVRPGSGSKTESHLPLAQLNALSVFVASLRPDVAAKVGEAPRQLLSGAQVYNENGCTSCHKVNGAGGGIGPPLNGLILRRTKQWVEAHFEAPKKLSPGSIMPPYRFNNADRDALVTYLYSLPD
jgi:ubiquinol-cytochrome c reductase cytochrome b subunit